MALRTAIRADAFDNLRDVEAAYWAGFLYADGAVAHKPRWTLNLNLGDKDREHVRAFAAFVGSGARVGTHATTGAATCAVYSRALIIGLIKWGVVPRKSYTPCAPPKLQGAARTAFLRGLFDGDGCLHVTKRGHLQAAFCGHPDVVGWFVEQVGVPHQGLQLRERTAYAQWTGAPSAKAVARALYGGCGSPHLARKFAIARAVL